MTRLNELAAEITAANDQLNKAKDEIITKIDDLEAALQDVTLPAEAQAALDNLKTLSQAIDDVVPDTPEEPPVV